LDALTLAFIAFVPFQVFNARAERGTSFDHRFFGDWMLCCRSPW
jgi:hypothetical protein